MDTNLIGAHVSAAGGPHKAIERAKELGVVAIQTFGSSPRQYQVTEPKEEDVAAFKAARKEAGIEHVFLHAPYLVNMASSTPAVRHSSRSTLAGHLRIAQQLGADGVVVHTGSVGKGNGREEAVERVVKGVKEVLEKVPGSADILLENGSGGGGKIGSTIEDIAAIVKGVDSDRVGVCIDTCHAFAAGVLVFTPEGINDFFDNWEQELGKGKIRAIHANDSKGAAGSYLDRHENIGEGLIGKEGFKNLSKDRVASRVPWILEVPGFEGEGPDKKNVDILKKLIS